MADENATSNLARPRSPGQMGRDRIALLVVVSSFLTLFLLVGTLVALAKFKAGDGASGAAEKAFNAILPVLAGWVGTVLAFYFSAASQEKTNEILATTIKQATGRAKDGALVSDKMIPLSKIRGIKALKPNEPSTALLSKLREDFTKEGITRMMFLEGGVFKYLLHVGTLNKYLSQPDLKADSLFADLVQDPDILNEISKLVVFVPFGATLAEAKAQLDKVNGAQDIIITPTGDAAGQVLGWLTNVDLTKALTVV